MSYFMPRATRPTDIKRDREEDLRKAERERGARTASTTTISSGGTLTVDGGDVTVKNGGGFRVVDGGSMDIYDDGVIRVNGQGFEPEGGNVYKVTAEVTSMDKAGWINYRSPGIRFTSEIYGTEEASLYSREGRDILMSAGQGIFGLSTSSAFMGTSDPDGSYNYTLSGSSTGGGVQNTDVANGIEWGVSLFNREQTSGSYVLLPGGEFMAGHNGLFLSGAGKWSRMRTQYGGKIWIESKGTGTSSLVFPGDGTIKATGDLDVAGSFTVNGLPIKIAAADVTSGTLAAARLPTATTTTQGAMPAADKAKLDNAVSTATASRLMIRDAAGRVAVATPAAAGDAATKDYVDVQVATRAASSHTHSIANVTGLQTALDGKAPPQRWRFVAGTSLPGSLTSTWSSFAAGVTVPADIFGVGVPYKIAVHAQVQANPTASNLASVRVQFNGTVPNGAKVNGIAGPNNGTVTCDFDFAVTTSTAVVVDPQAQSPFGTTTLGSGSDAPYFTISVIPYTAL